MPRPTKQTVDYFPHFANDSKTKFVLENRWHNDGYAFWFKLLEILCKTDGHSYCLEDPLDWEYFVSIMHVDDNVAKAILDKLSEMGKIDSDLWKYDKIIWCPTLMNNIKPVYDKRKSDMPTKPNLKNKKNISDTKTRVSATETEFSTQKQDENEVSDIDNPQSIVEDIIVEDITPSVSPPATQGDEKSPDKKSYGSEFKKVKLTDAEYEKLIERLGDNGTEDYIDRLDGYLAEGHRKKNHYATILNWWRRDNPKLAEKRGGKTNGTGFKPSRT